MSNYVNKLEFHNHLKKYIETGDKKSYEEIGKCFLLIATNYLNKPFYINYTKDWKGDMASEAVYDMIRYIENYDIDLMERYIKEGKTPNPFSYFSQYVFNGVMRYLKEKKKDNEVLVRIPFIENMDKRDDTYE